MNNGNCLNVNDLVEFNSLVEEALFSANLSNTAVLANPNAFADVIASHQQIVVQLEAAVGKIGTEFTQQRLQLESDYRATIQASESEFTAKSEALEQSYNGKKARLEEREKALDDRDNMHARREVRQDIKRQLHEYSTKFSLTDSTRKMRNPIHATVAISLIALWSLVGYAPRGLSCDRATRKRFSCKSENRRC